MWPDNGFPLNQMAVMAMYCDEDLETLYEENLI
jgi:hypothetical protein